MTWEELYLLLKSFKDEGTELSGVVRLHSTETIEPLDLVQSMTTDNLHFVARWDIEHEENGNGG